MAYAPITKIEKFIGEKNNTQVWFNDMEKTITINEWNDDKALQVIPYFLQDIINSWYQSLAAKPQTFQEFKLKFQPQQPLQQLQQQLQQPNLDPMAYAPIAKLEKFTSKKDDTQIWLNDIEKAIEFKIVFLGYFNNNNSINQLANTFTTIKQGENEAVTTYLGHFHRNLYQIQAIQTDYFIAPQILNQFIRGLCTTVTNARDFEAAELKTNHAQAIILVMNRLSDLDSKLKQLSDSLNQKLEGYLANNNQVLYQFPQLYNNQENGNYFQNQSYSNSKLSIKFSSILTKLPTYDAANVSNPNDTAIILTFSLLVSSINLLNANLGTEYTQNPNSQHYLSLLVTSEDVQSNNLKINQQPTLTSNIPPTTITENKLLDAIFPFKLKELLAILLFNEATLEEKSITTMYTNAKVDGHLIKLILNSRLTSSIITRQLIDQLSHRVDRTASA
ncbi:hypothetical protein G9A89_024004 [Geosiphon pyriformis]|nr:hypothetical protein G9A89_024004 [Geosiphon pyriformis]